MLAIEQLFPQDHLVRKLDAAAWYAMDNPTRPKKIVHASDAYFCIHEFKETGNLDIKVA
nr:hypothetical protein [Peribacillus alkalitolerans]